MKELANLTQANLSTPVVDSFSQSAAYNSGQFAPQSDNAFQDRINNITQPKSPAFVAGELAAKGFNWLYDRSKPWVSTIMDSLPYVGLPFAEAAPAPKIPEPFSLKLPRPEALETIYGMLEVFDAENSEEAEKTKNRFLKQVETALEKEGPLFEENVGIWVRYSSKYMSITEPKIYLFCDDNAEHGINIRSQAYYDYAANSAAFLVGNNIENEIMQNFVRTISENAAGRTRRSVSVSQGISQSASSPVVYTFDDDMTKSHMAIKQCEKKLRELNDKIDLCGENEEKCKDKDLEALKNSNRECVLRFPDKSPIVERSPFAAYKCLANGQFGQLTKIFPFGRRMLETSGVIKQILGHIEKDICSENYQGQIEQNQEFAKMVKTKSGGFRDDL